MVAGMHTAPTDWFCPPSNVSLVDAEVHVWKVPLTTDDVGLSRLEMLLDEEERLRASRFRFPVHHRRFVLRRAALRLVLSRYLSEPPVKIRYRFGAFGKPSLQEDANGVRLRFNASHSQDLALIAVAARREVGVDVEQVRSDLDTGDIASRFFSPSEIRALEKLPETDRAFGFFQCWTRKEAFIKAVGMGLSLPLSCFDVSLGPGVEAKLLAMREKTEDVRRWAMRELIPMERFVTALVAEGVDFELRCFDGSPTLERGA